jgi:hypothetical protein
MRKKKDKKHSIQGAQAKHKQGTENRDLKDHGLKFFVSHAFSNGWVQNSGVGFLFTFVTLIAALMTGTQIKTAAIIFAGTGTAFLWIAAAAVWKYAESENPPFAVSIESVMKSNTRDGTPFFAEHGENFLCPVPLIIFIRIVNLQDIPSEISELKVQIELMPTWWGLHKNWLDIALLPGDMPMYAIQKAVKAPFVTMASSVKFGEYPIESSLKASPLGPHKTLRGWMAFDVPAKFDSLGNSLNYRVTIRDATGNSLIAIPPHALEEENLFRWKKIIFGPKTPVDNLKIMHFYYPNSN